MKNNSKKTNKQNTAHSAQNTTRRMSRRTKDERRNILFSKKHVKMETRRALYGSDHGAAYALARSIDLNRRFVAVFLALVFAISTMVIGLNFVTKADPATTEEAPINSNLVLDKQLSVDENGNYTLQLSAYAKGVIRNVDKKVPTDYILVVDQSGSMSQKDMPVSYVKVADKTEWHLDDIQQAYDASTEADSATAYYYYDENDNEYYRVYKKWGAMYELVPRNSTYVKEVIDRNSLNWFVSAGEQEQSFDCIYYYRPLSDPAIQLLDNSVSTDGHFYPIKITVTNGALHYKIRFTYKDINNTPRIMYGYNDPDSFDSSDYSKGNAVLYHNLAGGGLYHVGDFAYDQANNVVVRVARGTPLSSAVLSVGSTVSKGTFTDYTYAQFLSLNTGMYIQNPIYIGHVGYNQLCYKDKDGVEHKLINTRFCDSDGTPLVDNAQADGSDLTETTWNGDLYTIAEGNDNELDTTTRLAALNHSLKQFIETVSNETDEYNGKTVDHRVAIVGFSSSGYNNNEILSGVSITDGAPGSMGQTPGVNSGYSLDGKTHDGTQYTGTAYTGNGGIVPAVYYSALVNTATASGEKDTAKIASLNKSIDSITAYGGTQPAIGLNMAYNIIDARDSLDPTAEERNTVVIFFTDGRPGNTQYVNQYDEANKVVETANRIKDETNGKGAKLYTIGVFGEADGNPLTYAKYARNYIEPNHTGDSWRIDPDTTYANYINVSNREENSLRVQYEPGFVRQTQGTLRRPMVIYQEYSWLSWRTRTPEATNVWETDRDFFRMSLDNTYGYPDEPNDTIADYMSVTSSEYPNATSFNGSVSTTYEAMTSALRGQKDSTGGRYYYTGSSGDNLDSIFESIAISITESGSEIELNGTNSYLQDVLSANFEKTDDTLVTAQTYYGWMDTDTATEPRWGTTVVDNISQWSWGSDKKTLNVEGFNYTENYIAYGKNADAGAPVANRGKKLVVTITGLKPTANATSIGQTDPNLPTNGENSGIFQKGETATDDDRKIDLFDSPTIQRYEYKLNAAQCADSTSTFDVAYSVQNNGVAASNQSVVFRGDGNNVQRADQLTNNTFSENGMGDTDSIFVEYISSHGATQTADPTDFALSANVTPTDSSGQYTYYLGTTGYPEQTDPNQIPDNRNPVSLSTTPSTENAFYINSKDNNRIVTVHLTATPSDFVDNNYSFTVNVSWSKDGETGSQTLTMPYNNGQIADQTVSVPYGATVTVSHEDYFYDTKISDIGADQGTSDPVTITNVTANKDIYITDTARSNIGEGIAEDTNPTKIILCGLAGLAVLSGGAGAAYVYHKKDEFVGR